MRWNIQCVSFPFFFRGVSNGQILHYIYYKIHQSILYLHNFLKGMVDHTNIFIVKALTIKIDACIYITKSCIELKLLPGIVSHHGSIHLLLLGKDCHSRR